MKKAIVIFSLIAIVASCGNEPKEVKPIDNPTSEPAQPTSTAPADAEAERGLELIAQSDCLTCHKVEEQLVGPPYMKVAEKYQDTEANIDTLASRVIRGSIGHWGQVPMTAHPTLSEADAKAMVKYVLSLK
ncbi:MAG TPA: c-type cytochrome [Flavisolibacter sp.]